MNKPILDTAQAKIILPPIYTFATKQKASPFVKWVGGKRSILRELLNSLPNDINTYYEPFVGGGALYFEINGRVKRNVISDSNLNLVVTYKVIQKEPNKLIEVLKEYEKNHDESFYYKTRKKHDLSEPISIASRFIYLNKTCYNGLWRVNSKGEFNVPMGRYKNPNIVGEENIFRCHDVLRQKTDINNCNFDEINPVKGDFVYFDPPYHPTDETSFTKYTKSDFGERDQMKLKEFCDFLDKKGVKFMLSNSDTRFIRDIYRKYVIKQVQAPRLVNCKALRRKPANELLITNY